MLFLHVKAPFAAFRTMTAGSYRPTADFITPSAAYGLLLNIAGIEMRYDDGKQPMTLIQSGLPRFRLALGALSFPEKQSVYQQLHNYPVGNTGKEHAPHTKGSKYNIAPARRAFLSGIDGYLCLDGNADLEWKIKEGLQGKTPRLYGLPFLGDNSFLPDRIEPVDHLCEAYWFLPIISDTGAGLRERITRLTISIDRADMSQTDSSLFAPVEKPTADIPEEAWVEVGY